MAKIKVKYLLSYFLHITCNNVDRKIIILLLYYELKGVLLISWEVVTRDVHSLLALQRQATK